MPLLANLYILDAKQIFSDFELIVFLGYMLKAVLCFGAGCLIGYLHQQENNRFTLFQLGLGVPALLLALLNGSQYAEAQSKAPEQEPGITQGAPQPGLSLLSFSVYADSHELLTFETPEQTAFEKLMRGFGFSVPERDHFVIVGAYETKEESFDRAERIRTKYKGLTPRVYDAQSNGLYTVVIDGPVTSTRANEIWKQAIDKKSDDLSHAYVWRFGESRKDIRASSRVQQVGPDKWLWGLSIQTPKEVREQVKCIEYEAGDDDETLCRDKGHQSTFLSEEAPPRKH